MARSRDDVRPQMDEPFSSSDMETLAEAHSILEALSNWNPAQDENMPFNVNAQRSYGRLMGVADAAAEAIMNVIITASAYGDSAVASEWFEERHPRRRKSKAQSGAESNQKDDGT